MNKLSFEQVRQLVYNYYREGIPEEWKEESENGIEIMDAGSIDELVEILDGLGFNGYEAFEFILESIIEG